MSISHVGAQSPIGTGAQDIDERLKFESEARRVVEAGNEAGLTLRLLGSLAVRLHCPRNRGLQAQLGRTYADMDLAAYGKQAAAVAAMLAELGYVEDREISVSTGGGRASFENPENGLHLDVFYEKLDSYHVIPWAGRLEQDSPTIPLAELLLEKMQIVEIDEKDILETIMLLLEHPMSRKDEETINIDHVARLCAEDWGLWRTATMNLNKVKQMARSYTVIDAIQQARVAGQVDHALARIEAAPKPLHWTLRNRVGDRLKWYKDVDEVK
jgi:hypothetical protein